MSSGHFNYLLQAPKPSSALSEKLELLAKTAAKRYIEERVPLTDTIRKLASANDLNPHQIERVCEIANIATHQALWPKTAEKHTLTFPLADARAIVGIQKKATIPSGAPSFDYSGPPKDIPHGGPSLSMKMGVDPSKVHHGLGQGTERSVTVTVVEKKAAARQRLKDQAIIATLECETAEKNAYHMVKQAVLGGSTFQEVYDAAIGSGLGAIATELLPAFQERLTKEAAGSMYGRLKKLAILKAPEDLLSTDVRGITVVNGANPVMVSLDTVQRKNGVVKNLFLGIMRIDDEIKVYNQKIRELS